MMNNTAAIIPSIPANLHLADPSILTHPQHTGTIHVPRSHYIFPRKDVPTSYPVVSFAVGPGNMNTSSVHVALQTKIFGAAIRKDIILDLVRYHRLQSKQPHKTKRKSEIRGSNKKPHPQKGSGRAQAGHKRNAIW
jgi:hypothetical protein